MNRRNKKTLIRVLPVLSAGAILAAGITCFLYTHEQPWHKPSIKIGLLHQASDTIFLDRATVKDMQLFAIDEINASGGVLGYQLEPVVMDGGSTEESFIQVVHDLITKEKVACIFSGSYSAQRRAVRPMIEKEKSLLLYCEYYEGLDESPNIFFSGDCGNQNVMIAVTWILQNLGKKIFVLTNDSIFARALAELAHDQALALGHEIAAIAFVDKAETNVQEAIEKFLKAQPDVILNFTANGTFFHELKKLKNREHVPTVGFNIFELTKDRYNAKESSLDSPLVMSVGDFIVTSYFQNIQSNENAAFLKKFHQRYGKEKIITANMVTAYCDFYLWKQAVEQAKTFEPSKVIPCLKKQYFHGPGGIVYYQEDHCCTKKVYIGKIRSDQKFDIIWDSGKAICAQPYPLYRSKQEWELFLKKLYESWGNRWINPY